jgi:hypothetical protein
MKDRLKSMRRIKIRYDAENLAYAIPMTRDELGLFTLTYIVDGHLITAKGTTEDSARQCFERQYINWFFHGQHAKLRGRKKKTSV